MIKLKIPKRGNSYDFAEYVMMMYSKKIKSYVKKNLDKDVIDVAIKLYRIDRVETLIDILCDYLRIDETKKTYDISVDSNIKIGNHKIIDICGLIEYGNMSAKGLSVFSKCSEYIKDELGYIKSMYMICGG